MIFSNNLCALRTLHTEKQQKITVIFYNDLCILHTKFQRLSFSNATLVCKNDIFRELSSSFLKNWKKCVLPILSKLKNIKITMIFSKHLCTFHTLHAQKEQNDYDFQ